MATARTTFDFGFRPDYWDLTDPVAVVLQNIKGQMRRVMVEDIITGRAAANAPTPEIAEALREIEPGLLVDELTERMELERVDPRWMGGEYLPSYARGEVEIARLVLDSSTTDVTSIRARRGRTGRIRYRVVDEYACDYDFRPRSSSRPLTLGQLIRAIDGLTLVAGHGDQSEGLLHAYWDSQLPGVDPDEAAAFAWVESVVYPQLGPWYRKQAAEWAARKRVTMRPE